MEDAVKVAIKAGGAEAKQHRVQLAASVELQ
jgi:hypothetical protein